MFGLYLLGVADRARVGGAAQLHAAARHAVGVLHGAAAVPLAHGAACCCARSGRSASAFLRRAGTIILAASIVLWVLLTFPRALARSAAHARRAGAGEPRGERGGAHRPRDRARDRAARLRLEDRRRAGREPGRARGDRRDARADLRRRRHATTIREPARRPARGRRPGDRPARLHPADRALAAGVLRVRAAVHVDHRGDGARDRQLALAGARVRLHARPRLDRRASSRIRSAAPCCRPDSASLQFEGSTLEGRGRRSAPRTGPPVPTPAARVSEARGERLQLGQPRGPARRDSAARYGRRRTPRALAGSLTSAAPSSPISTTTPSRGRGFDSPSRRSARAARP